LWELGCDGGGAEEEEEEGEGQERDWRVHWHGAGVGGERRLRD
jgi:hypothetical protein